MTTLSPQQRIQSTVATATLQAQAITTLPAAQQNYERLHNIYLHAKRALEDLKLAATREVTYPSVTKGISGLHDQLERIADILRPYFDTVSPIKKRAARSTVAESPEALVLPLTPRTPARPARVEPPSTGKRKRDATPVAALTPSQVAPHRTGRAVPLFQDDIVEGATITPRRSPQAIQQPIATEDAAASSQSSSRHTSPVVQIIRSRRSSTVAFGDAEAASATISRHASPQVLTSPAKIQRTDAPFSSAVSPAQEEKAPSPVKPQPEARRFSGMPVGGPAALMASLASAAAARRLSKLPAVAAAEPTPAPEAANAQMETEETSVPRTARRASMLRKSMNVRPSHLQFQPQVQ